MTNVEALKALYVNMGGDEKSVRNFSSNSDMINAIAELVLSGAAKELPQGGTVGQVLTKGAEALEWANVPTELPEYSSQDVNKMLGIVEVPGEGKGVPPTYNPAWVDAPSGSSVLIVTAENNILSSSIDDIKQAVNAHIPVMLVGDFGSPIMMLERIERSDPQSLPDVAVFCHCTYFFDSVDGSFDVMGVDHVKYQTIDGVTRCVSSGSRSYELTPAT